MQNDNDKENIIAEEMLIQNFSNWCSSKCPEVKKAIDGVIFIAAHTKREEDSTKVRIFKVIIIFCTKTFFL